MPLDHRLYGAGTSAAPPSAGGSVRRRSYQFAAASALAVSAVALLVNEASLQYQQRIETRAKVKAADDTAYHGDFMPQVTEDGLFMGRFPNSLLTLFYPYTLLRDVVLEQPVNETDIPFYWYIHEEDEIMGRKILTECYGLKLIELKDIEGIEKARETNLVSTLGGLHGGHVVFSPHIRETCTIFNMDNFGRMFSFFRHPLDYNLVQEMPTFPEKDNYLVRLLADFHEGARLDPGPSSYKRLGVAKKVVYVATLVGRYDMAFASWIRIQEYMGFKYAPGKDETCVRDVVEIFNPKETVVDHNTDEWEEYYKDHMLDCQLYEQSQMAWRGQIQTAIPLGIQLQRAEPADEDEEER